MSQLVVLKIGGSLGNQTLDVLAEAVRAILARKELPVVVHGGGPRISRALREKNLELPFVQGQRLTTAAAVPVIQQVLEQEINGEIVFGLRNRGVSAQGLFGSAGLLQAQPLLGMERTAGVGRVDLSVLRPLLNSPQAVVIAPLATNAVGDVYNVNADTAAAAIAAALPASKLVLLTDVPGIYVDYPNGDMLTDTDSDQLWDLLQQGRFAQGMYPKVQAVLASLEAGVKECFVVHGGDLAALTWALADNFQGGPARGTRICQQQQTAIFEKMEAEQSHA
jgi:acetylglutamate kinase